MRAKNNGFNFLHGTAINLKEKGVSKPPRAVPGCCRCLPGPNRGAGVGVVAFAPLWVPMGSGRAGCWCEFGTSTGTPCASLCRGDGATRSGCATRVHPHTPSSAPRIPSLVTPRVCVHALGRGRRANSCRVSKGMEKSRNGRRAAFSWHMPDPGSGAMSLHPATLPVARGAKRQFTAAPGSPLCRYPGRGASFIPLSHSISGSKHHRQLRHC